MTVCFSTNVYEESYRDVLSSDFIPEQINAYNYPFDEFMITVNNVDDRSDVERMIKERFPDFQYYFAHEERDIVLQFFGLTMKDMVPGYWYSINNLCAIMHTKCTYILHVSEDCYYVHPGDGTFIVESVAIMDGNSKCVSSMPSWDPSFIGPMNEANHDYRFKNFWAGYGFSDQVYLLRVEPFLRPSAWKFRHQDSERFPIGDTCEKRIDAYMRCNDKLRLVHKRSWYDHRSRSGHTYKLISAK